jgi:DNA end-binding protein Ku
MRAIWKGSLSFGLVNIPVNLYSASHDKEISFVLLHKKDNSPIRYARMCKSEEKEVPWSEIVKGYEYDTDEYVIMDEKDFEQVNLKKTKTIEIAHFVNEEEVDSIYYSRPYFLEPGKNAEKAYGLLREALKKSKKVGLAKYVLRNREHIATIKVHGEMLVLNELRYQNELLIPEELNIPSGQKYQAKELAVAMQLIDQLTETFKPDEYEDTYTEELKKLLKQKAKGKITHIAGEPQEKKKPKIHDIMSLLQASLKETKKAPKKAKKAKKTA